MIYINTSSHEANKEKSKEYREANRERIAKKLKEYREANRERIAKKQKEYRANKLKNDLVLSIQDNGTGISDELRDKIFSPNFTTKNSGMGLGLALVKNIIESSEGEIWFESTENVGTTFFISLPVFNADMA